MKCPQCAAENAEGKNFCCDCGSLLAPQLIPLVRFQVGEYLRENLKNQKVVDVETTEAIAERFLKWGKWFLIPATFLLTVLGLTLALFGVRDYTAVHRAAQQAITTANIATKKAQDADTKAGEAIQSIDAATARMNAQLTAANQLSTKLSGVESKTTSQIADASKHVEERVTELDKKVEVANNTIAGQQAKLTSTNELVTAMFSKGRTDAFLAVSNQPTVAILSNPEGTQGGRIFMLLKEAPIFQTVQIQYSLYIQPKYSYFVKENVLVFVWGDPLDSLKKFPLMVSYVPDPTYHGAVYSALSVKDRRVFADDQQIP